MSAALFYIFDHKNIHEKQTRTNECFLFTCFRAQRTSVYSSQKTKHAHNVNLFSSLFFPLGRSASFVQYVCVCTIFLRVHTCMCRHVLSLHIFSCVHVWVAECCNVYTSHALCRIMHLCQYNECILLHLMKYNI